MNQEDASGLASPRPAARRSRPPAILAADCRSLPLRSTPRARGPGRVSGPAVPKAGESAAEASPSDDSCETAKREPGGGAAARPTPRPQGRNRNLSRKKRNAAATALPCPALPAAEPLHRRERDGCPLRRPHRGPSAGRRVATAYCRPPLASPLARPPGTRPAPPLTAAHRAEADPAGWLRRHLERATKPGPASAATRLGGGGQIAGSRCAPPTSGAGGAAAPPTHFRPPGSVELGVWERDIARRIKARRAAELGSERGALSAGPGARGPGGVGRMREAHLARVGRCITGS